jgi:hypothetical protein
MTSEKGLGKWSIGGELIAMLFSKDSSGKFAV